jgi:hypothetical protein
MSVMHGLSHAPSEFSSRCKGTPTPLVPSNHPLPNEDCTLNPKPWGEDVPCPGCRYAPLTRRERSGTVRPVEGSPGPACRGSRGRWTGPACCRMWKRRCPRRPWTPWGFPGPSAAGWGSTAHGRCRYEPLFSGILCLLGPTGEVLRFENYVPGSLSPKKQSCFLLKDYLLRVHLEPWRPWSFAGRSAAGWGSTAHGRCRYEPLFSGILCLLGPTGEVL